MYINSSVKKNNYSSRGFTLVEVIVAISIGLLVMTTFMSVFASGFRNIRIANQTKKIHANVVYMLNTITYDIKQAEDLDVLDSGATLKITFSDSSKKLIKIDASNNMTIEDDPDTIPSSKINLNGSDVKITEILGFDFFQEMEKSVRINFTIESISGEVSLPITTTIARRNNL